MSLFPGFCFLGGEQDLQRTSLQEAGLEQLRAEAHEVFGGREKASAGPFVAVVDVRRVFLMAIFGEFVKPGTLLNDLGVLVRGGVARVPSA